jgi:hypothetical protein
MKYHPFVYFSALKWCSFGFELFFGMPIFGRFLVLITANILPLILGIVYLITLYLARNHGQFTIGSIAGLITLFIEYISPLAWIMHLITAVILLFESIQATISLNKKEYLIREEDEDAFLIKA